MKANENQSPSYVLDELQWEVHHLVLDLADTRNEIRSAPRGSDAIYAVPCFLHAKIQGENPVKSAEEFAERWNKIIQGKDPINQTHQRWFPNSVIQHFEASRGYVNVFVDQKTLLARILKDLLDYGEKYGSYPKLNKTMVVDYCSPNIAKPLSVGHLRSTIIGQALINILRARGYEVVGINFMGDWGTQFGKLIYAFEQWGDEKKLESDPIQHLLELYVRFHKEAKNDPTLEDEGRAAFKRLQQGGEKERALWQRFRESSLEAFEKTIARLGVKFDHNWFESDFEGKAHELIDNLLTKGIAEKSEGAVIIQTSPKENIPPVVLRKSDGATLYAARDLASAVERIVRFHPAKLLYVVGSEQRLHFSGLRVSLHFTYRFDLLLAAYATLKDKIKRGTQALNYLREIRNRFVHGVGVDPNEYRDFYYKLLEGDSEVTKLWHELLDIIIEAGTTINEKINREGPDSLDAFEDFVHDLIIFVAADIFETPEHIEWYYDKRPLQSNWVKIEHIHFGMVSLPEGKISTREGRIVYLDDLLDEAKKRAAEIITEKNPDMAADTRDEVARRVGIGSVIYADLSQDRIKDIVFDWKRMLAFDGNSAPYLQYAAVRCARILQKAGLPTGEWVQGTDSAKLEEPESIELVMALGRFPQAIAEAAERYAPHVLAGYLYDVATSLSRFYTQVPVLKAADEATRLTRLGLVQATESVLRRGLALLGIQTPEVM